MKILGMFGMVLMLLGACSMDSADITAPVIMLVVGVSLLFIAGKMYEKTERKR